MARATYDHQFAMWPRLGKFPCSDEWTAKVKSSVDQDAGNVCERTRVAQQDPLFKPCVVTKIVCHETRKRELKCGLKSPWVRFGLWIYRHQG